MNRPASPPPITIRKARAHNLQDVDLRIPHHKLVVVTGVSGSGKSSLAFDTVCREGQRRYLESFSNRARQLLGKLGQPDVESIDNLSPAIALDQKTSGRNPRSTVGTISELHGYLRLLFARLGASPDGGALHRSDFSFNSAGACESCRGLGVQDAIDPELLIDDPRRTLRQGALVITTDSGYVIYSQVTMDVLNEVCQAHGFHVDIPWQDLTDEQRHVILYGSDRIEIAFGKHTLESRMKWSGIKARPRQTGYYGGIVPVMEQILKRDRNRNILRFVRTGACESCAGTRLNKRARMVQVGGHHLADLCALTIGQLDEAVRQMCFPQAHAEVGEAIVAELRKRSRLLLDLGLGYLTLDRDAPSLSGGEAQRIRLATIAGSGLRGITYVLDEPSIGLHPRDQKRLLNILRRLVDQGNSVIVVEHDRQTMLAADWLIEVGPGAGTEGGQILYAGPPNGLLADTNDPALLTSLTRAHLRGDAADPKASPRNLPPSFFAVNGASLNNLDHLDVDFQLEAFNVVSGVSGAGKSSLLQELGDAAETARLAGDPAIRKLIHIDQAPIGRTPRSNAATYTGLFDHIRALFAAQPRAVELGLGKGQFSFNNKGGRCANCEGAGVERLGMHFLGDVEVPCEACGGRRFGSDILSVTYRGLDISEVLAMPLQEAASFFSDQPRLGRYLDVMVELGLGYLSLGQPSTTLSGGEAQRVKLAAELSRPQTRGTCYILDEPTTGLHAADMAVLLKALDRLVVAGGTVVVSEHNAAFLHFADRIIDLGPDSGQDGGRIVYAGPPAGLLACAESVTGQMLAGAPYTVALPDEVKIAPDHPIELLGVQTHNLKNFDVAIPTGKITVVTGVSGSGKSSLAMGTLHAEGRNRYAENFSTYVRQQLTGRARADLAATRGLTPTVAVGQGRGAGNPRSTVATAAEIHPLLRLLMSRFGAVPAGAARPPASFFSFNHHSGACEDCRGLGHVTVGDPTKLVSAPEKPLLAGALDGHKASRFYGEPDGQYVATLRQVGLDLDLDFSVAWQDLPAAARKIAMHGAGQRTFDVVWHFKRGKNAGQHEFHGTWPGFCGLITAEYQRKHADKRGLDMLPLMRQQECPSCAGQRLQSAALAVTWSGLSLARFCSLSVSGALEFLQEHSLEEAPHLADELNRRLNTLRRVGLGYLSLDRATESLSTGEYRRLRLAQQLGARLQGLTCILDEPTLGLHPRDTACLWEVVTELRDQGNTLVLVEHDPEVIEAADHVIDLGPGAGHLGGHIVAQGTPTEIRAHEQSATGRGLRELAEAPLTKANRTGVGQDMIRIRDAHCHNLKNIDVAIPIGCLTAVVGVSGSGKTSLIFGALAATADSGVATGCAAIEGLEKFGSVVSIRQGILATGGAGNPATASGLSTPLRALMASTETARESGLMARHFSAAQKGGRCEPCQGAGLLKVPLDFLADVQTVCPDCQGTGFGAVALACRWRGKNIADFMALTVAEALEVFADEPKLKGRLQILHEVGLSYLSLGQPTRTLSGGERQRLHLAAKLLPKVKGAKKASAMELILCDEPTAGLHMQDVQHLVGLLKRLTAASHTVVVTEHNSQLISAADHVIELGPGAGDDGGRLV